MGQAQINVRTRACSRTSIARTRQAALTHNVRGKELMYYFYCLEFYFLSVNKITSMSFYVKRFELRKETVLNKKINLLLL